MKASSLEEILDAVLAHKSGRGNDLYVDFHVVTSAESAQIFAQTGLKVDGFVHAIDYANLAHAVSRHFEGNEKDPRNIPLTRADLLRLEDIVSQPDSIQLIRAQGQLDKLVFKRRIAGTLIVVEEVRTGRKKLVPKTIYKNR